MHPRLLIFISGFLGGVASGTLLGWGFAVAGLTLTWAAAFLVLSRLAKERTIFVGLMIFWLAAALGLARVEWPSQAPPAALESRLGEEIRLTGLVAAEPDERDVSVRLVLRPEGAPAVKVLVTAPRPALFRYGDRVAAAGRLARPENFATSAGREFAYVDYLASQGISYQLWADEVAVLERGRGFFLQRWLFSLKRAWLDNLGRLLPEPEASLGGGLVVGGRQGLGEKWQEVFRRAGLSHIVVLSGYNLSVVADNLMRLLNILPLWWRTGLGALAVALFTLMAGAGPAALRAALMALLALLARATGRTHQAAAGLGLAVFLMVLHRPLILVWDFGFQLSVLATLGLIYLAPIVEQRLTRLPRRLGIRGIAASAVAAQLSVLPWLVYKTGELSLWALPANLLVLPFVPAAMFTAGAAGILGFASDWLARPLGFAALGLVSYILAVAKSAAGLPGAAVLAPSFPLAAAVVCYGFLVWVVRRRRLV